MTSSAYVQLQNLTKHFGKVKALDGLNLSIADGEFVALLGPSGCGKTTALRALAGLQDLDKGEIIVDGKNITGLAVNKRNMGMVFQAYSLFPHMTARQNVEYGLRMRVHHVSNDVRTKRSGDLLELVGLSTHMNHYPHQMSGGQQQRVALARALAIEPEVLLLDEPLSALDAKVRTQLRDEIRRIQLEIGTTTLFVTHDQEEALTMSDRIAIFNQGKIEQLGSPKEIYEHPATPFVSEFVGKINKITHNGARVNVRPEFISVSKSAGSAKSLQGRLKDVIFSGAVTRYVVEVDSETTVIATTSEAGIEVGNNVYLNWDGTKEFLVK